MTNCDGLVSQFRIVSLFYGSKKLIHVDVYDFPFHTPIIVPHLVSADGFPLQIYETNFKLVLFS